ncbi:MAG: AbrB/MazE/SpoVT family DNA-binding domain-containing protein [Spirochaetaceae bacterium]|nr:MAG: AbrB/MazE/SpoVT family DNA-binding domain-containing protein [Spirochaetaceae bacterium]
MATKVKIDSTGRVVIPKALRDRYGLVSGSELELFADPDGITLIPSFVEHRVVRRGRVVAIDTGAGRAPADIFELDSLRSADLDRKSGFPK